MKPIVPQVPLPVWEDLYRVAKRVHTLRPWETLDDLDLIALRDPATGQTGFGVFMGSAGTMFGICLYRGAAGFEIYQGLIKEEFDLHEDDFFAVQNCLMVEFGSRRDLQQADLEVIRSLGATFKGKVAWPQFRSLLPGYAPWFLTEEEARFLTLGLTVACYHLERLVKGEIDGSLTDDACLIYTPRDDSSTEFSAQWEPFPVAAAGPLSPPILNLARLNAIRAKKPRRDSAWEMGAFYLPSPIDDAERPYYARGAVVCEQSSGIVLTLEMAKPEDAIHQVLVDTLCGVMEKHGVMPDTVFVKDETTSAALIPLGKALGITIRRRKNLPGIRELKDALMLQLMGGGGRR